jgi:hypothetical protein
MAGVGFTAKTVEITIATGLHSILQILAAANHAFLVKEWSISFKGIVTTGTPILVELLRQTTAGTGGAALTLVKSPADDYDETIQASALSASTVWSAEPTAGDVLDGVEVHPQTGYTWQAPFGQAIKVGGGDRIGIRANCDVAVGCIVTMKCEE